MNDRHHVDPLLTLDVVLVDQLAEAMQLRQELEPDPGRDQAIRQLHAIRNHLVHHAELAVTSDESRAAMTLVLRHLVATQAGSLGDARSRHMRRRTSPATVSEILTRAESAEHSRSPQRQQAGRGQSRSSTNELAAHATLPDPTQGLTVPTDVRYGERRWGLSPGQSLTFGRAKDCDIRLPEDPLVPRRAGALFLVDGAVHVRNDSSSLTMYLIPVPGRELQVHVPPGMTAAARPDCTLHIVLSGRHEIVVGFRADTGSEPRLPAVPAPELPTAASTDTLAPHEIRMLAALCEPLLARAGEQARPATYTMIAHRLGVSPKYVRQCLEQLRERLTTEDSLPRLGDDHVDDWTARLATWALHSGMVTTTSLDLLNGAP